LISADAASAAARWDLLNSLEEAPKPYPLRSHGTAADLVELWSSWVRGGAADGFTVIPASLPTDVVALVHEVIPALRAKGLRKPRRAAAENVAATPARPARHAAGHGAQTGERSAAGAAEQETSTLRRCDTSAIVDVAAYPGTMSVETSQRPDLAQERAEAGVRELATQARVAARQLRSATTAEKNAALHAVADHLVASTEEI